MEPPQGGDVPEASVPFRQRFQPDRTPTSPRSFSPPLLLSSERGLPRLRQNKSQGSGMRLHYAGVYVSCPPFTLCGCAQLLVSEDGVGWDARTLDDRTSADLSGNAFNQIAFRPVYGHFRLRPLLLSSWRGLPPIRDLGTGPLICRFALTAV